MNIKWYILIMFLLPTGVFSQRVQIPWPDITDSTEMVDTRSVPITNPGWDTYFLDTIGIWMSTEFPGSRVHSFKQKNDSTLEITIRPENHPINMSPWYAFRLWTDRHKTVQIKLRYRHGTHRYPPRISHDGIQWNRLDSSATRINTGQRQPNTPTSSNQ